MYAHWVEGDKVTINYEVATAGTGSVSTATEEVLPITGVPTGSTATPAAGYKFVNWTLNGAEVATTPTFVPTKAEGAVWEDGTTYVANFVLDSFTLTFANDGNGAVYNTETPTIGTTEPVGSITVAGTTTVTWEKIGDEKKDQKAKITVADPTKENPVYYYAVGNGGYVFSSFDKSSPISITANTDMKCYFVYGEYYLNLQLSGEGVHGAVYSDNVRDDAHKVKESITVTGTTTVDSEYMTGEDDGKQKITVTIPNADTTKDPDVRTFYAIGDPGYVFKQYNDPVPKFEMIKDTTLSIVFELGTYTISFANDGNGKVYSDAAGANEVTSVPNVKGTTKITSAPYSADSKIEEITFSYTPEGGSEVTSTYYAIGNTNYMFDKFANDLPTCVDGDTTITANFKQVLTLTIDLASDNDDEDAKIIDNTSLTNINNLSADDNKIVVNVPYNQEVSWSDQ